MKLVLLLVHIDQLEMEGQRGVILTPTTHIRLGRERLLALRAHPILSELDGRILAAVQAEKEPATFVILRGASDDNEGSWGFEGGMTRDELAELAYLMVHAQMLIWRTLAQAGVTLFIKVEWGARETDAIGAATLRIFSELKEAAARERDEGLKARLELDAWVARYLSFWLLTSYADCKANFLPRALKRTETRIKTLRGLISQVPDSLLAG